eukprot:389350_1
MSEMQCFLLLVIYIYTAVATIISGCPTDIRCGLNWNDANAKCGECCVDNSHCTIPTETCFAHLNTAICPIITSAPTTAIPSSTQSPDELFCGDSATGPYSDGVLTFNVQMAYYADLTFDASQSTFHITTIEAYSRLNVVLGQDTGTKIDEILTLFEHPPGDYKFIIEGASGGTYNIQITCTSDSPTPSSYVTEITKTNSSNLVVIGMVCGLFCIICCLLVIAILIINKHYKGKSKEDDGINGIEVTGIDEGMECIDNEIMPNNNRITSVFIEGLPLPSSFNTNVNQPMHLQNNISTCTTDMESMYGSVKNTAQHMQTTKHGMNLNTIDQMNENYNDKGEYEYYYE